MIILAIWVWLVGRSLLTRQRKNKKCLPPSQHWAGVALTSPPPTPNWSSLTSVQRTEMSLWNKSKEAKGNRKLFEVCNNRYAGHNLSVYIALPLPLLLHSPTLPQRWCCSASLFLHSRDKGITLINAESGRCIFIHAEWCWYMFMVLISLL